MKTGNYKIGRGKGFTLLEIVVTLMVASILGAFLIQFMSTNISRSSESVVRAMQGLSLVGVMEAMTADYKRLTVEDSTPLATFRSRVEAAGGQDPPTRYGIYTAETRLISFDGSLEQSDECTSDCHVLRVTISREGQTVTAIFTE